MRRQIAVVLPTAAAAAVAFAAPAVAGAPLENRTPYEGSRTFTECDGAYEGVSTYSGTNTIQDTNPSLEGEFFRFTDHYTFTDVLTNVDTGDYVVISGTGVFKELQPRSEGDGVFSYVTHDVGRITFSDSSGNVLIREAGMVVESWLFDTLNDGEPGGNVLDNGLVRVSGPHPTFPESFDFCGFLDEATG